MLAKQTEIKFYKADCLVHHLTIKWRPDMTHLLVTISDIKDQLLMVMVEDTLRTSPIQLLGASVYKLRAYGLRKELTPRTLASTTSLYAVEALQTVTIFPGQTDGLHSRKEIDMTASLVHTQIMSILKCQNNFEAEVLSEDSQREHRLSADPPVGTQTILCSVFDERRKKEWLLISNSDVTPLPAISVSRTDYQVHAVALKGADVIKDKHSVSYLPLGSSSVLKVKTYMNKKDLQGLQHKAAAYSRGHATGRANMSVKKLYRNKPKEYFEKIMADGGLMAKYDKDNNGDPYSSINHQIEGLFFSAILNKRKRPPHSSFFGNKRLFLPVEALINDGVNLYFADFYCNNAGSKVHYVTVVVTKDLSKEDIFCRQRLLKLERENPFFTVTEADGHTILIMPSVDKFHVEFLYTEDIHIVNLMEKYGSDKVTMKLTKSRGRGRSKPDGIPKVPHCPDCNLSDTASSYIQGDLVGC